MAVDAPFPAIGEDPYGDKITAWAGQVEDELNIRLSPASLSGQITTTAQTAAAAYLASEPGVVAAAEGAVDAALVGQKGVANGIATLDGTGVVPAAQVDATVAGLVDDPASLTTAALSTTVVDPLEASIALKQDVETLDADVAAQITDPASQTTATLNSTYAYGFGIVQVEKYRLDGDTDAQAVQRAYDAAQPGQKVQFEPGRLYEWSPASGVPGLSMTKANVDLDCQYATLALADDAPTGSMLIRMQSTATGARITQPVLDGKGIAGGTGIRILGSRQSVISPIAEGFVAGCIYLQSCDYPTITNMTHFGGGYGIATLTTASVFHVTITGFRGYGSVLGDAIELNVPEGIGIGAIIEDYFITSYHKSEDRADGIGIGLANFQDITVGVGEIRDCRYNFHCEDRTSRVRVRGLHTAGAHAANINIIKGYVNGGGGARCENITIDFTMDGTSNVLASEDFRGINVDSGYVIRLRGSVLGVGTTAVTDGTIPTPNATGVKIVGDADDVSGEITVLGTTSAAVARDIEIGSTVGAVRFSRTAADTIYAVALPAELEWSDCDFGSITIPGVPAGVRSFLQRSTSGQNLVERRGAIGSDVLEQSRVVGDISPRYRRTSDGRLSWGSGTTPVDVELYRDAANRVTLADGDSFRVQGTWNGGMLQLGTYRLWVDSTGKLLIKNGVPTSDTDGTVVGTQT